MKLNATQKVSAIIKSSFPKPFTNLKDSWPPPKKNTPNIGHTFSRSKSAITAQQAPLPVPLLRHNELNKLQDQAVANRNPARVQTLETIRESLACERSENTRTDKEIARLDGQLLVVRSEQAARQERAHQFERTRHQTRWQINDKNIHSSNSTAASAIRKIAPEFSARHSK